MPRKLVIVRVKANDDQPIEITDGMTVGDAMESAGFSPEKYTLRLNGEDVTQDDEILDSGVLTAEKEPVGN